MASCKLESRRSCEVKSYIQVLKLLTVFCVSFSLLFVICYSRFSIKWHYILPACIFISLAISVAASYSKTTRCVLALSSVKLAGPQSRYIFMTIITGIMIGGPLVSIVYNLHEVNRTVNCTTSLVKNQSKEIQKAYNAAYKDVSNLLTESVSIYKEVGSIMEDAIRTIKESFENVGNAVKGVVQDSGNAQRKCRETIFKAGNDCKNGVIGAYDSCLRSVPSLEKSLAEPIETAKNIGAQIQHSVAKPIEYFWKTIGGRRRRSVKDLQHICYAIKIDAICEPLINKDFCSVFDVVSRMPYLSPSLINELANKFKFSVNPTKEAVNNIESDVGSFTGKAREMRDSFDQKFELFKLICGIVKHILTLLLFAVPLTSYLYLRSYHKATRNGKLNKFFQKDSRKEVKKVFYQLVSTMAHFQLCFFVFSFDYLLFESQTIAHTYGGATFNASGSIHVNLNIKAGWAFQSIVERFLKKLGTKQTYQISVSTYECLPKPMSSTGLSDICIVAVLYVLIIVSFVLQRFTGRLKQEIVQRFYPVSDTQENTLMLKN